MEGPKYAIKDPVNVAVGQRLREVRALRGWSCPEAVKRFGEIRLTIKQLSRMERGEMIVPVGLLVRAAEAYNVSVGWFLYGSDATSGQKPSYDPDGLITRLEHELGLIALGDGDIRALITVQQLYKVLEKVKHEFGY